MNSSFRYSVPLCFLIFFIISQPLTAQDSNESSKIFTIESGTILTGFSIDGTTASRDDYHPEVMRGFSRLRFNVDGMYFVNDRIGVGPVLGYEYEFDDYEDPGSLNDRWFWNFLYGAKAGWYIPVEQLFNSGSLDNSYLFVNGGLNWQWSRQKSERFGKLDPNNRFGYQLGAGLLVPLGQQISLEWKLGWESRRRTYRYTNTNDQLISETKWLHELSVGLGLKVIF